MLCSVPQKLDYCSTCKFPIASDRFMLQPGCFDQMSKALSVAQPLAAKLQPRLAVCRGAQVARRIVPAGRRQCVSWEATPSGWMLRPARSQTSCSSTARAATAGWVLLCACGKPLLHLSHLESCLSEALLVVLQFCARYQAHATRRHVPRAAAPAGGGCRLTRPRCLFTWQQRQQQQSAPPTALRARLLPRRLVLEGAVDALLCSGRL